jgi:hypothetical protein
MAAGTADRVDHFGAQLVGELAQLALFKLADVRGFLNSIEQRGYRT